MLETTNTMRVSLAIKCHLSDAMIEVQHASTMELAQERLRFVKYLVHMFPDTDAKADMDAVYQQFKLSEKRVA
jgi:hypothetical protein